MKNISLRDVFYGIVLIACVVLYSYLTRYEVVWSSQGFMPLKFDRLTGTTYIIDSGSSTVSFIYDGEWIVLGEPKN